MCYADIPIIINVRSLPQATRKGYKMDSVTGLYVCLTRDNFIGLITKKRYLFTSFPKKDTGNKTKTSIFNAL